MVEIGFNFRIPDILYALGISPAPTTATLDRASEARARRYDAGFQRKESIEALESIGGVSPIPSHSYYRRSISPASTPVADGQSERLLTLPLHPELREDCHVDFVLKTFRAAE
jgi:dTDP-4-amino-4,6-dideoxygalactose transaminase